MQLLILVGDDSNETGEFELAARYCTVHCCCF